MTDSYACDKTHVCACAATSYLCKYMPVSNVSSVYVCDMIQYGVATVSRIDEIIGLFCRILSLLYGPFTKETCNFIDPTNQSHPIICVRMTCSYARDVTHACVCKVTD